MSPNRLDILPDVKARQTLAEKEADLVSLSSADVQADTEPLGATMDRLAVEREREALTPALKSCVASLPVEFAVMLHEERDRLIPVLHVFRKGQREISIRIAQGLPDLPAMNKILQDAITAGFESENFELTSTGPIPVDGYQVRNVGVVSIPETHCIVAFLNRRLRLRQAEDTEEDPGAWAPWDAYTLSELRRRLGVSPLQISHVIFEREFRALLRDHPGEWVVYYKDERLGVRATEAEAEQLAIARGIPERDTYLRLIEEEPPLSFGCRSLGRS